MNKNRISPRKDFKAVTSLGLGAPRIAASLSSVDVSLLHQFYVQCKVTDSLLQKFALGLVQSKSDYKKPFQN